MAKKRDNENEIKSRMIGVKVTPSQYKSISDMAWDKRKTMSAMILNMLGYK